MIDPALPSNDSTLVTREERTWALVAHLSGLAHFTILGHIAGPLIIWLVKRDSSPFIADQAKEALNAQLTATIYFLVATVLCFVVIGFLLLPLISLLDIILVIVAALSANDGKAYRYPFILRLIK